MDKKFFEASIGVAAVGLNSTKGAQRATFFQVYGQVFCPGQIVTPGQRKDFCGRLNKGVNVIHIEQRARFCHGMAIVVPDDESSGRTPSVECYVASMLGWFRLSKRCTKWEGLARWERAYQREARKDLGSFGVVHGKLQSGHGCWYVALARDLVGSLGRHREVQSVGIGDRREAREVTIEVIHGDTNGG